HALSETRDRQSVGFVPKEGRKKFARKSTISVSVPDDRYVVSNGSGYTVLICWDEYAVLDRELDTTYLVELDTPYSANDQNIMLLVEVKTARDERPKNYIVLQLRVNYNCWKGLMLSQDRDQKHIRERVKVIVNGDAPAIASASASTEGPILPKIAEQKLATKNELKAKCTLFRGNKESKKLQKTILKQQYENFTASRSEGLDKTYDRVQKLISQLEIHGEVISQEDANLKLLRSLPLVWNNIALIMRNKADLDGLSMDDLYNNLKVYEAEIKSQSSSSSNSQNVAFVYSDDTNSNSEVVNTAHDVPAASLKRQASSSSYADDVMFSFFVNQSNSPQLDNEDMEQIDTNDLEEMDLKCVSRRVCMAQRPDLYLYLVLMIRPNV
ncbi:hypothetical protein Tco_1252102, partial [Tanacetum coccineum]